MKGVDPGSTETHQQEDIHPPPQKRRRVESTSSSNSLSSAFAQFSAIVGLWETILDFIPRREFNVLCIVCKRLSEAVKNPNLFRFHKIRIDNPFTVDAVRDDLLPVKEGRVIRHVDLIKKLQRQNEDRIPYFTIQRPQLFLEDSRFSQIVALHILISEENFTIIKSFYENKNRFQSTRQPIASIRLFSVRCLVSSEKYVEIFRFFDVLEVFSFNDASGLPLRDDSFRCIPTWNSIRHMVLSNGLASGDWSGMPNLRQLGLHNIVCGQSELQTFLDNFPDLNYLHLFECDWSDESEESVLFLRGKKLRFLALMGSSESELDLSAIIEEIEFIMLDDDFDQLMYRLEDIRKRAEETNGCPVKFSRLKNLAYLPAGQDDDAYLAFLEKLMTYFDDSRAPVMEWLHFPFKWMSDRERFSKGVHRWLRNGIKFDGHFRFPTLDMPSEDWEAGRVNMQYSELRINPIWWGKTKNVERKGDVYGDR